MRRTLLIGENNLNWNAKGMERIVQNLANLFNTYRYEIAYDRTKCMNPDMVDKPAPEAIDMYRAEVYRIVSDYQPNVQVEEISAVLNGDDIQFQVVVNL